MVKDLYGNKPQSLMKLRNQEECKTIVTELERHRRDLTQVGLFPDKKNSRVNIAFKTKRGDDWRHVITLTLGKDFEKELGEIALLGGKGESSREVLTSSPSKPVVILLRDESGARTNKAGSAANK